MNTLIKDGIDDQIDIDPNQDPLAVLTGPGGKYDRSKYTSEEEMYKAMARGKLEADLTINVSNRRQDELREEARALRESINTGTSVKEMLDQFKSQMTTSRDHTDANEGNKPVYDPNEVKSLISSTVQEIERDRKETANFSKVDQKLREVHGANYANVIKKQIDELGLSVAEADALAKKSPDAFFRMFGLDRPKQQENFEAPIRGSDRRSDTFLQGGKKRDNAYYVELKKKDKDLYFSPKIQKQMIQDMQDLGADFGRIV